jgi:peptide/nickel transport system permease protein
MSTYVIRRVLMIPILLFGISVIDFVFINIAPGDPVTVMLSPTDRINMSERDIERRREALGLNKPIHVRYVIWVGEVVTGNLGFSLVKSQPVSKMVVSAVKNTIVIMTLSLVLATTIGVILGVISALRPYSAVDYVLTAGSFIGVAMPGFFLSLILIRVGALELGWFPTSGLVTPGQPSSIADRLHHMVLPLIALSIGGTASILRYTRSSMLEVLREEYMTTARAKGLAGKVIVMRHALKNALLPLITVVALEVPGLFGGSVIVETIFNIPGMGQMMVEAMQGLDYPILMGGLLIISAIVIVCNLLADVAYALADPRIRY